MNTNKAIEIEGEVDEDEFQEKLENLNLKNNASKTQPETKISETVPAVDYSNIETIEQMMKAIQSYYTKELNSSITFCDNLS